MANPLDIKAIMSSALARLAKKYNSKPSNLQVRMFLNKDPQAIYFQLIVDGAAVKNKEREDGYLSFNKDILDVRVDLFDREAVLNQILLPPVLERLSAETGASPFDLSIMVGTMDDATCNAYLYLYKGTEDVRQLFIEKDF